jgi:hypothetical protein
LKLEEGGTFHEVGEQGVLSHYLNSVRMDSLKIYFIRK